MVGKICGQEETTPEKVIRRLVLSLTIATHGGYPVSFWHDLPLIELVEYSEDINELYERARRQSQQQ